jgi:succinate dehydrogenase / fumarate reductase, membrane anchor subunit
MIDKRLIADPRAHYGSPKSSTRHFIIQRITGMANVLFLLFFAWFVVRLAGAERAEMVDVVRNPLVAIVLALLIVNVCLHMRVGMREVLEDYLDEDRTNRLGLMLNTMFTLGIGIIALVSIAKIVFVG